MKLFHLSDLHIGKRVNEFSMIEDQKYILTQILYKTEQEKPDGDFPTCPYPTPEILEAMQLGLNLCEKLGADLLLATDPDADPARTEYTATDWRIVQSAYGYKDDYEFFNYIDRSMVEDTKGWDTQGEYGDELVFDDYEAAIARIEGGIIWESKLPLHNLSNDAIAQLVPQAGMTVGFDFSVLDVDLPCPGIHSLRMQFSAELDGRDRTPSMHNVDANPSLWATLTFVD